MGGILGTLDHADIAMHRRQIEELKRAEKEASARVQAASTDHPFDAVRYKRAFLEWQSARIALLSAGVRVPEMPESAKSPPARQRPVTRKEE